MCLWVPGKPDFKEQCIHPYKLHLEPVIEPGKSQFDVCLGVGINCGMSTTKSCLKIRQCPAPATDQSDAVSCARHKYSFDDCLLRMRALKRQCHDNRWFLAAILCAGKVMAASKGSPRKTTFSGGKRHLRDSTWAADRAVMVWCPRHLREQSPFLLTQKKRRKSLRGNLWYLAWVSQQYSIPFLTLASCSGLQLIPQILLSLFRG